MQNLKEPALASLDLAINGITRRRCIDLCGMVAERYEVMVHERMVGKLRRRWE